MTTVQETGQTVPEVDRVLTRLRHMTEAPITLSQDDARWLLAEIDGGREAFGILVLQKTGLEGQVRRLQRTVDDMLSMRGK